MRKAAARWRIQDASPPPPVHICLGACKKTPKGYFVHTCTLEEGMVQAGEAVIATVDEKRRHAIMRNHYIGAPAAKGTA